MVYILSYGRAGRYRETAYCFGPVVDGPGVSHPRGQNFLAGETPGGHLYQKRKFQLLFSRYHLRRYQHIDHPDSFIRQEIECGSR